MILFLILIALNILICYLYHKNVVFPILFMLSELIFGMSIIAENELYVIFMILFCVIYNMLIINEIRSEKYVRKN